MARAAFFLLPVLISFWTPSSPADELYIASWNVENLFDLKDDLGIELDEEFTPASSKRWTAERLETKLSNLAGVIRKMNDGRGPDVLGLCEVENRLVVEMLVAKLAALGRSYQIVHRDSPSDRGIDCALIYDAAEFKLADSRFHFVDAENTRDIVEANLQRGGDTLYVFVNHWPSRGNDEWQRIKAATVLRDRLEQVFAADDNADVVLLGDFNDESENVSLTKFLLASPNRDNLPVGSLYNTTAPIEQEGKGTFVWDNKWELIDHIIVSQGMLGDAGFKWKPFSSHRVDFPEQYFQPRWPGAIPRPSKSYAGDNFHRDGHSDHLPVACVIEQ
jgi:predicted extracellular nuclease